VDALHPEGPMKAVTLHGDLEGFTRIQRVGRRRSGSRMRTSSFSGRVVLRECEAGVWSRFDFLKTARAAM